MRSRTVKPKALDSQSAAAPGSGYFSTGMTAQGGTERLTRIWKLYHSSAGTYSQSNDCLNLIGLSPMPVQAREIPNPELRQRFPQLSPKINLILVTYDLY